MKVRLEAMKVPLRTRKRNESRENMIRVKSCSDLVMRTTC